MTKGVCCPCCELIYSAKQFYESCAQADIDLFAYADAIRDGFEVDTRFCMDCGHKITMLKKVGKKEKC